MRHEHKPQHAKDAARLQAGREEPYVRQCLRAEDSKVL